MIAVEPKLKTFEIQYKMYYHENSDYGTVYYKSQSKQNALKRFAKENGIDMQEYPDYENWEWSGGDWLYKFKNIQEVSRIKCPAL